MPEGCYFALMLRRTWIPVLLALAGCGGPHYSDPLDIAAATGRLEELRQLLAQGVEAGAKNGALKAAARAGQIEAIALLLRAGADPNARGGVNDWTPVMHGIHKNQRQSVLALLDGGADVNGKNRQGLTALMMAAGYGYADMVRDLLAQGADPYAETKDGATALTGAVGGVSDIDRFTVCSCQTETVKALLEKAPDLKLKDNFWGRASLWFARIGNCKEVLDLLEQNKKARAGL